MSRQSNLNVASIKLSKTLSYSLRHGAVEMKIPMRSDGYVEISHLLKHSKFRGITLTDILNVVEDNNKKRFECINENDVMFIRAVQGHTLSNINDEELLITISDPSEVPLAAHGTYKRFLSEIQSKGLCRMKRNHIHMSTDIDPNAVISGARQNAEVYIIIDVEKAMADNIKFYRSKNGVLLSPGLTDEGVISPQYFKQIVFRGDLDLSELPHK